MSRQVSTRFQVSLPHRTVRDELPDIPGDMWRIMDGVETSAIYGQGTLSARPAAAIQGRFYEVTDRTPKQLYYDDGTTWNLVGGNSGGTTLPATPIDGQLYNLRLGTSPYEFVRVIWDATYGKWVSDIVSETSIQSTLVVPNNASYVNTVTTVIENFKVMYDAGLRPQFTFSANAAAATLRLAPSMSEYIEGGGGSTILTAGDANSIGPWSSTFVDIFKTSGKIQPTVSAPTYPHATISLAAKNATGTNTLYFAHLEVRMVSP